MRRAFSVLELLVVIAIIILLVGLAFPTFLQSKKEAGVSATMSNLRQQWLAIKMYQEANGGEGNYSDPASMNLPDTVTFLRTDRLNTPEKLWRSPCGRHPQEEQTFIDYYYRLAGLDSPYYVSALVTYEDHYIAVFDSNCNAANVDIYGPFDTKRGIGVELSGQVIKRIARGDMRFDSWWTVAKP